MPFHPPSDDLTYEPFFGLREKPFGLNSDPRFLYQSSTHAATYQDLLGGIRRREGLLVLTGEIGTGKTTLCRAVLKNLGRKTFSSFVPDPFASREDLLKTLLIDFGVISIHDITTGALRQASRTELGYLLSGFLESIAPLDAFAVVIVDEAQNLTLPLIEETRILSDSFGTKGHLQIVFVGQPELHAKLQLPEMRQVDQRVCGYSRLEPLSHDAVAGYIQHRLHVAGGSRERVLFSPDIIEILHSRSGGVPRLVNRICDRALHVAYARQAACVDREILESALIEIGPITLTPTWASIMMSDASLMKPPSGPSASSDRLASMTSAAPGVVPAQLEITGSPSVDAAPAKDDASFSERVDEWVQTQDRTAVFGEPPSLEEFASEDGAAGRKRQTVNAKSDATRKGPSSSSWRDTDGELRPETYMQRLARVWGKRAAIAAACAVALNAAALGASQFSSRLTGLIGIQSAPPPQLPARPELAVAGLASAAAPAREIETAPAAPSVEVPRATPPAVTTSVAPPVEVSKPAVSGGYHVAVGLFASPERADRLVQELTGAGFKAHQRPFQLRSRRVKQVVIGPFATRAGAVADLQRLRQLGGYDDAHVLDPRPASAAP